MTRINAGIPPEELSDKHLLAEHREIKRIPNAIAQGKAKIEGIPDTFCLGKGHVKFFYDKILYLHNRYDKIYHECIIREFNITDYSKAFLKAKHIRPDLYNNWKPTEEAIKLIKQRIHERTNG